MEFGGAGANAIKGCYAYEDDFKDLPLSSGKFFYGTGGTEDQMKQPLSFPTYRLEGYDCYAIGNLHNLNASLKVLITVSCKRLLLKYFCIFYLA